MIDICFEVPMPPKAHARAMPMIRRGAGGKPFAAMVTPPETRRWQSNLASIAAEFMPRVILDEPLRVDILSVFQRPKSKDRAGRGLLWHASRPDADNVAKNVTDALRPFWRDDSRIAELRIQKVVAELGGRSRVVVRIRSLGNVQPEKAVAECGLPTDSKLDGADDGPPDSDFYEGDQPPLL